MQVEFRNKKLERCFTSQQQAFRAWGDVVGKKYIQRIGILQVSANLDVLCSLPGLKCHPLKGERKGQYAISLTGFWRLIITFRDDRFEVVCVEEVSKHYDD